MTDGDGFDRLSLQVSLDLWRKNRWTRGDRGQQSLSQSKRRGGRTLIPMSLWGDVNNVTLKEPSPLHQQDYFRLRLEKVGRCFFMTHL